MGRLRTHRCGDLRKEQAGEKVILMGWLHSKRELGHLLFLQLRDHSGFIQISVSQEEACFHLAQSLRLESVIEVKGELALRPQEGRNLQMTTGEVEIKVHSLRLESEAKLLPFPVSHEFQDISMDLRLTYRYLDLRTQKMQHNVKYRSKFIKYLRDTMFNLGFNEIQTPILTASSPEGARDFLVPSRLHAGKFYALPQAPQQFKQLLMCSGFDRYFQIAPCFRDEDARADRSPGEFYQLDLEMSFVTQDDVFDVIENVMKGVFDSKEFTDKERIKKENYLSEYQRAGRDFPCIPWKVAMERYGSDKPDLRYDLRMFDVGAVFAQTTFGVFSSNLAQGGYLKALVLKSPQDKSRRFFDDLAEFAKGIGLGGVPWLLKEEGDFKGSFAKFLSAEEKQELTTTLSLEPNDAVIFIVGPKKEKTLKLGGEIRQYLAKKLNLISSKTWSLFWVVDFPMFEFDEKTQTIEFSHNPFSLPQCSIEELETRDLLSIDAYQYDLVCNGIEIASGAIRNHRQDMMKRVFEKAGYTEDLLKTKFKGLWEAFSFGAPPHGGIAPGIDRILMLLLDEENIREVIPFPLSQNAMDLMMNAPSPVSEKQLKEVHISLSPLKEE